MSIHEHNATQNALKLWRHIFDGERGLLHIWSAIRDDDGRLVKPKSANFIMRL